MGSPSESVNIPAVEHLPIQLSSTSRANLDQSKHRFAALDACHQIKTLVFNDFGKEKIKTFKCSPDAFVQLALQFAYYKMFGQPCATYESGSTRKFYHGRTETIRSCTSAALAFCQAMEGDAEENLGKTVLFISIN